MCFWISASSLLRGIAPTSWLTTRPPLKIKRVGIDVTRYCCGTIWWWSTSIFATLRRPLYSLASASTVGAICLQGPHHTAQKSTRVGISDLSTSASKFASVSSLTFSFAIATSGGCAYVTPRNEDRNPLEGLV